MSDPAQIIAEARRLGLRLRAEGDSVLFYPQEAMTPSLADRIKAARDAVLTALRGDDLTTNPASTAAPTSHQPPARARQPSPHSPKTE